MTISCGRQPSWPLLTVWSSLLAKKCSDYINVMLDPCSTSSYVTKKAAEELGLRGESVNLTIAGTGGIEIQKRLRRVELNVTSLNKLFTAPVQAHVLENIVSDTPAIPWAELKTKWPHLHKIPFNNVSKRQQIDVMLGDHPVFYHVLKEVHGSQPSDPVARLTNLGWVCFGPTLVKEFRCNSRSHFTHVPDMPCKQTTAASRHPAQFLGAGGSWNQRKH